MQSGIGKGDVVWPPVLRQSLHVGVLPGEGAASRTEAPTFINNTDLWPMKSTDASYPLSFYFKQHCYVGWL